MIERLLRRKPKIQSYRGRARWCNKDGAAPWHLHFDPPFEFKDVEDGMHASFPIEPPPPEGEQEFAIEFEIQRPQAQVPWMRIAGVVWMVFGILWMALGVVILAGQPHA